MRTRRRKAGLSQEGHPAGGIVAQATDRSEITRRVSARLDMACKRAELAAGAGPIAAALEWHNAVVDVEAHILPRTAGHALKQDAAAHWRDLARLPVAPPRNPVHRQVLSIFEQLQRGEHGHDVAVVHE